MLHRDAVCAALDTLLEISGVKDYGPNGLQVGGRADVHRVVCGVTASLALIAKARALGAQMLVVHHGIFWGSRPPVLRGMLLERVRSLIDGGITLLAYHLPLDRHLAVGNNAPALLDLGLTDIEPFAMHEGMTVGYRGRFATPIPSQELLERVTAYYGGAPRAFLEGPDTVRTLGLVSGAAQGDVHAAVAAGLDAFVTGEVSEYNLHVAREERIHHLSVGHHASERVGPRRLARWITENLEVEALFVDDDNPV